MIKEKGKSSSANAGSGASSNAHSNSAQNKGQSKGSNASQSAKSSASDKTAELEKRVEEMQSKYLLLSADFDNYRKRMLKERTDLLKSAGEDMLKELLPIMDNFERALKSMESAKDIPSLREGVELIFADFKSFFNREGVKEIECEGKAFSTDEQEAVARIPARKPAEKGKVIECVQKGYKLNDKVIRFARVVVAD